MPMATTADSGLDVPLPCNRPGMLEIMALTVAIIVQPGRQPRLCCPWRSAAIIDQRHDRDRQVRSTRLMGLSATSHCAAMTGAMINIVAGLRTGAHETLP